MTKIKLMLFILIFASFHRGLAQEWLVAHIYATNGTEKSYPFLSDPFYEEMTYGKVERNTGYYDLRGAVKSAKVTKYYINADTISGVNNSTELTFNSNFQLVYFKYIPRDYCWTIEEYTYKNQKLSERKTKNKEYSDSSKTNYKYNDSGYLAERELYFKGKYSRENEVYHYITKFSYNNDYTSVRYKYYPITKLYDDDMNKGKVDFSFDGNGNYNYPNAMIIYDSLHRPVSYFINNGCGRNSALCISVSTVFDSKGNIIEQIVDDQTTRNADWSFSNHFKAGYDDNNRLIWKEYHYLLPSFVINTLDKTGNSVSRESYEYIFDDYENWTILKIYRDNKLTQLIERKIAYCVEEE